MWAVATGLLPGTQLACRCAGSSGMHNDRGWQAFAGVWGTVGSFVLGLARPQTRLTLGEPLSVSDSAEYCMLSVNAINYTPSRREPRRPEEVRRRPPPSPTSGAVQEKPLASDMVRMHESYMCINCPNATTLLSCCCCCQCRRAAPNTTGTPAAGCSLLMPGTICPHTPSGSGARRAARAARRLHTRSRGISHGQADVSWCTHLMACLAPPSPTPPPHPCTPQPQHCSSLFHRLVPPTTTTTTTTDATSSSTARPPDS